MWQMLEKKKVLMFVEKKYDDFMITWEYMDCYGNIDYELIPYAETVEEKHHLIAKAANKYWELIGI